MGLIFVLVFVSCPSSGVFFPPLPKPKIYNKKSTIIAPKTEVTVSRAHSRGTARGCTSAARGIAGRRKQENLGWGGRKKRGFGGGGGGCPRNTHTEFPTLKQPIIVPRQYTWTRNTRKPPQTTLLNPENDNYLLSSQNNFCTEPNTKPLFKLQRTIHFEVPILDYLCKRIHHVKMGGSVCNLGKSTETLFDRLAFFQPIKFGK